MNDGRIEVPLLARLTTEALEKKKAETNSTGQLINALLADAVRERASDIHLDPTGDGCGVRFRIDGEIVDTIRLDKEKAQKLSRAITTHAGINAAFNPTPQDGYCEFQDGERKVAVRVATAPCVAGEKIAIRFLPTQSLELHLKQLGLKTPDLVQVLRGIQDTNGMVLISGPTGSGKTTTAYALLRELMATRRSIATIEDPVEFHLEGASQMQINPRQGLTFCEGIAGLLRLDPDVIMLGEIRDAESARCALTAADGGHLFISTLHARDAAGTLSALRNYGLRDYEIAANLNMIVAQRLVRRLCLRCCRRDRPTREERRWLSALKFPAPRMIARPVGCPECSLTGYRGRIGIFEVVRLGEAETELILKHTDEPALRAHFRRNGAHSLIQDELEKVAEGITSLSEVYGVAGIGAPPAPVISLRITKARGAIVNGERMMEAVAL